MRPAQRTLSRLGTLSGPWAIPARVLPGNQIRDSPARAGALGKQPILTLLIQPLKASARACAQAIKRVLVGPIGFVQKQRAVPTMPSAM